MLPKETVSNSLPFREFTPLIQANFFEKSRKYRFTGQILLTSNSKVTWIFYMYLGRIIYATGGLHPVRRWKRNVTTYLPHLPSNLNAHQKDLAGLNLDSAPKCWEYELLCLWVKEGKISLEEAATIIRASIVEILFDITQARQIAFKVNSNSQITFSNRLVLIDAEAVIAESSKLWQAWQAAKIADRSPDMAPVITQAHELEQKTNPKVYKTLTQLLDGQQTLRDLGVRMKKDVITVTRSLVPYVQRGLIKLVKIPDLPSPIINSPPQYVDKTYINKAKILIAGVDDSPLICQTMEQIITEAGYDFIGIKDPLRAIAILIAKKPDLIFLDLLMPHANGYEICSQLRKLSFFKKTPIVILTGHDGLVDRVRAKIVGSSDFIAKPLDKSIILRTIRKHLRLDVLPNKK